MNKEIATYFKVFSDPTRLEIIELLLKGETCGCTLIDKLTISQPTLSYHLKTITKAGLASAKKEGNWIKYYIDREKIKEMIAFLKGLKEAKETSCSL